MNIPFLPILVASISTFVAISLLRPFAISIDLVDKPNNRKLHHGSVPLIGGIAMFFGVIVGLLILSNNLNSLNYLILSSFILLLVGILDDHRDISVSVRLVLQTLVAIILVTIGETSVDSFGRLFGNTDILLGNWSYFFSIVAIIFGINAINMSDGIHGLAGGTSLISIISMLFLSIYNGELDYFLILLLLSSSLSVFLVFNICVGISQDKRIFMGDAGSMFIGLMIAWLLINMTQGNSRLFSPVTALWIFSLPIFDMMAAILRRVGSGKSPFKPDLNHSHHLIMRLGFGEKNTLLVLLLFSCFMSTVGILGEIKIVAEWIMFTGFIFLFLLYLMLYKYVYMTSK